MAHSHRLKGGAGTNWQSTAVWILTKQSWDSVPYSQPYGSSISHPNSTGALRAPPYTSTASTHPQNFGSQRSCPAPSPDCHSLQTPANRVPAKHRSHDARAAYHFARPFGLLCMFRELSMPLRPDYADRFCPSSTWRCISS